jgi:hypothetical protein
MLARKSSPGRRGSKPAYSPPRPRRSTSPTPPVPPSPIPRPVRKPSHEKDPVPRKIPGIMRVASTVDAAKRKLGVKRKGDTDPARRKVDPNRRFLTPPAQDFPGSPRPIKWRPSK